MSKDKTITIVIRGLNLDEWYKVWSVASEYTSNIITKDSKAGKK